MNHSQERSASTSRTYGSSTKRGCGPTSLVSVNNDKGKGGGCVSGGVGAWICERSSGGVSVSNLPGPPRLPLSILLVVNAYKT